MNNETQHPVVVPFVDLAQQTRQLQDELQPAILKAVESSDYILGSAVAEFEAAFARFVGVKHAIGVACGLDALRLSLAVLDIGPGDEVILPANTFIASALAVSSVGARPVFVDCDEWTYNIDVSQIGDAITPRTRAILPVHLTGQAANMEPILNFARQHDLKVIEDACQAHGAMYGGRMCGSIGDAGCFSFYPSKNLGALGDGGMITTNDAVLAERLRCQRNYGQRAKYEHVELGVNSRLDNLQAAVLNVKLAHLPRWNAARQQHAEQYRQRLSGIGDLRFQQLSPDSTHVYHLFMIETGQRDQLQQHLARCGIETGVHYPTPIHLQPAYVGLSYTRGDFPRAELLSRRILSLPMFPDLSELQIEHVENVIRAFF